MGAMLTSDSARNWRRVVAAPYTSNGAGEGLNGTDSLDQALRLVNPRTLHLLR
jgi:hypothetical protein